MLYPHPLIERKRPNTHGNILFSGHMRHVDGPLDARGKSILMSDRMHPCVRPTEAAALCVRFPPGYTKPLIIVDVLRS